MMRRCKSISTVFVVVLFCGVKPCPSLAFVGSNYARSHPAQGSRAESRSVINGSASNKSDQDWLSSSSSSSSRREWIETTTPAAAAAAAFVLSTVLLLVPNAVARAADFTPGGTLANREVGITVGNPEASASRTRDNSNVLFHQDYYFKFGTAAPWLEPDGTDFPKTMPFTRIQQRYDALQKYQGRILDGLARLKSLEASILTVDNNHNYRQAPDPTATDVYYLRPMGLLANTMLASENSGATNELFLARWYINELYLLLNDVRKASSQQEAAAIASAAKKAANSYLTLMNRVITPKVGDKFEYLK